jgi:hypothetical protein
VNTFDLPVPCYSTGRKELRKGKNQIFITTDGLTECPNTNFEDPQEIFKPFEVLSNERSVKELLMKVKNKNVRDSTTIISWNVDGLNGSIEEAKGNPLHGINSVYFLINIHFHHQE